MKTHPLDLIPPPTPTQLAFSTAQTAVCEKRRQVHPTKAPIAVECLAFIVHSHLRWDFVWQRPQQILSRLAANHPVLFVEDPLWETGVPTLALSEPYPNVIRAIPRLPPEAKALSADAQCEQVLPLLHAALRDYPLLAGRFNAPIQWFYSPMTAPAMLGQFNATRVVYDCMDELAQFRFAPPDIIEREQRLLASADVVFTGGYQLYRSKSRHHRNVHFYGCGVDVEHFGQARLDTTALPPEVAALPRPILGYFGVIDERLDYELLHRLALATPNASLVMTGPVAKVEPEHLPKLPNIHWLGQRPYQDLPALVKSYDVCLMPFALNEATQYINPTKTLEYMAAGKPIVSTAVPDVIHNFAPIVDVAYSHDEFIRAVARASATPDAERVRQGIACADAASWDAIVSSMRGHIIESIRDH
jgi:glycosyltransferase involved in cell wall biosynthesis